MDQVSEMQDNLMSSDINVTPIMFEEESRESFTVKHRQEKDDLILQIFPKHDPKHLGARVAKAFVDTIGEVGMAKIQIEEVKDDIFGAGTPTVYVKCKGMGVDYYQRIIFNHLFENLQESLSAKQA